MADLTDDALASRASDIATLQAVGRLRVHRLAKQLSGTPEQQEALYNIAAGHQTAWDTQSWRKLLRSLDHSKLTVADWLLLET